MTAIDAGLPAPLAAMLEPGAERILVIGGDLQFERTDRNGRRLAQGRLGLGPEPMLLALQADRLLAVADDAEGSGTSPQSWIVRLDELPDARLIEANLTLPPGRRYRAAWLGEEPVLGTLFPPLELFFPGWGDGRDERITPLPTIEADGTERSWAILSLVPLTTCDRRMLVTVGDLRSDRRILIQTDSEGNVARSTILDAPLTPLAAETHSRLLLALRATSPPELVIYELEYTVTPCRSPR